MKLDKTLPYETARVDQKVREHIQLFNKIVALREDIVKGKIKTTEIVDKLSEIIKWDIEVLLPDEGGLD